MSEIIESKPKARALKQYKITFHGEGGDVDLIHNFKLNLYKRNTETTIDENFLGVAKLAVINTIIQDADGKEKAVSIPLYQYSVESI